MWRFTDRKNRLLEVVRTALRDGPQTVEYNGDQFVIASAEDWERVSGAGKTESATDHA